MTGTTVLVTGAGGVLGTALAPALHAAGHRVRLLDFRSVDSPYQAVHGDVRDPAALAAAVDGVDAVVHLAALHGVHLPHHPAEAFWATNVEGTRLLYEACRSRRVRKVVLASTMGVYGVSPVPPGAPWSYVDDDSPVRPRRWYGMTKRLCEDLAAYHARADGIETVALRFGMFFPPPTAERYGFRLLHGGVDVADAADSVVRSLSHRPAGSFDTFNVFAGVPFTRADTAELGSDLPAVLERYWPSVNDDVRRHGLDLAELVRGHTVWRCDKAAERLGHVPARGFGSFLERWRAGRLDYRPPETRWGLPG